MFYTLACSSVFSPECDYTAKSGIRREVVAAVKGHAEKEHPDLAKAIEKDKSPLDVLKFMESKVTEEIG
jgi:predicted small metal-binding protein